MRTLFLVLLGTVALAGAAAPASVADSKATADPGHKLYVIKCGKCHKFYDPARYSDAKWNAWMMKMSKKAKLTPEQEKELSTYIQDSLRSGKNQRAEAGRH